MFKRLLFLPALLLAAHAQTSAPAPADANPADSIAPLYSEEAIIKRLKLNQDEITIKPCGLLSTGSAVLVLSDLGEFRTGAPHALVASVSTDGRSWERVTMAMPEFYHGSRVANVAAVYDSVVRQVVILSYAETPESPAADAEKEPVAEKTKGKKDRKKKKQKKQKKAEEQLTGPRWFVSIGKGGKFSAPREVSKQFRTPTGEPLLKIKGHGLHFQGICLTRGEHRGRVLILACVDEKAVRPIYSDDHGRTWKVGELLTESEASPYRVGGGLTLCEAEDGSVVIHTGGLYAGGTWLSSQDGGATWEAKKAAPGLPRHDPARWPNAFLVLNCDDAEGTNGRLLAFSLLDSDKHLFHVALSYDWGRTWPHQKVIQTAPLNKGANMNVQVIAPGKLGMLTNADGRTVGTNCVKNAGYTTFTLSWLTDGKDDGTGPVPAP